MILKMAKSGVLFIVVILFINSTVLAGAGARNISSQSAKAWIIGGARCAETNDAGTVLHNPSGAPFMEDGWHLHLSAFYSQNNFSLTETETGKQYKAIVNAPIPYFAITYKKSDWAGFFHFSLPGGNGSGNYDNDTPHV